MQDFSYDIRVSDRAKRLTIRILPKGRVEVVLPKKMPERFAHSFVESRASWIKKQLLLQQKKHEAKQIYTFETGERIPFLGTELTLSIAEKNTKTLAYRYGETLFVSCRDADKEKIRLAIHQWYKNQAKILFEREVRILADRLDVAVGKITIKNQKSLWGSCSRKGNLNFNWRLLLAPPQIVQYIVVHEVVHLIHHNHGEKFWSLVSRLCPQYQEYDGWLKQNGFLLDV